MNNQRFLDRLTGAIYTTKEYGKLFFEVVWQEQKDADLIPKHNPHYERPGLLTDEEYMEIGYNAMKDDEDFEPIVD